MRTVENENLEPARIEKESIIECKKCGWTTSATWKVDFEEDMEFYKKLLKDHKFMCESDFPDFHVKKFREEALYSAEQIRNWLYCRGFDEDGRGKQILNELIEALDKFTQKSNGGCE